MREQIDFIREEIGPNKKIVFVSGNFNIVHPGHLRLLSFARDCGDCLVVGVNSDHTNPDAIFIPFSHRISTIRSIEFIDYAFEIESCPEEFISKLKPDFVIKGAEYESKHNPESEIINSYGGKLLFSSGEVQYNSRDLLRRELLVSQHLNLEIPQDYLNRHNISIEKMRQLIQQFQNKKIIVIGDTIVDKYITCNPLGMSQEDPTLVVTPVLENTFIGGAAIVAAHAKGLGANVNFFSVIGEDDTARFALDKMKEYGVDCHFSVDNTRPTPHKIRYRSKGKTLLRVNRLSQRDIGEEFSNELYSRFIDYVSDADAVIFSDFNYGCLPQGLVDKISAICQKQGILVFGDSQSSSQIGDVSRFKNMTAITPTEREARLATHDFKSGLAVLANNLKQKTNSRHLVMTLGEEGLLIQTENSKNDIYTDRIGAFNSNPKDVSGAGDSLLCCLTLALTTGANIWESCFLASLAAAVQVGRVGNTPLQYTELINELNRA